MSGELARNDREAGDAEFVAAVTDPDSLDFIPERDRIAVFDNDGTPWTEQPVYAQPSSRWTGWPSWVISRAWKAARGRDGGTDQAGALTDAGITTDEFDAACRSWLALAGTRASGGPTRRRCTSRCWNCSLLDRNGFSRSPSPGRNPLDADLDGRCRWAVAAPGDRQRRGNRVPHRRRRP